MEDLRMWAVEQAMDWCGRDGTVEFRSDEAMEKLAARLLAFAETGQFPAEAQ